MNANKQSNGGPPQAALLRLFVFAFGLIAMATGCRSKPDLIEAELRTRENEVRQLQAELQRSETLNHALESELRHRQGAALPFPPPGEIIDRPIAMMANTVQRIELGRGTGGIDEDKWPGDEALQLVITPRDGEGSAIKAPGHLVVKVFEVSMEGLKVPMGKWDVSSAELQKTWRGGVFASGYFVTLPWRNWPNSERLRVVAQFATLPDNRWFEADKDVTIRLMPGAPRPGVAPELPSGSMPVEPPGIPPPLTRSSPYEPAAKIGLAKPAPPIEERVQQRLEAAKPPADRSIPPLEIVAPPSGPLRIEAPPDARPMSVPSQPARLHSPLPPAD